MYKSSVIIITFSLCAMHNSTKFAAEGIQKRFIEAAKTGTIAAIATASFCAVYPDPISRIYVPCITGILLGTVTHAVLVDLAKRNFDYSNLYTKVNRVCLLSACSACAASGLSTFLGFSPSMAAAYAQMTLIGTLIIGADFEVHGLTADHT